MCTVTVVPTRGAVRLACNRDELHSRPAAHPPCVQAFGRRQAVLPVDPVSGGTWVAVNDAGLAMTVLNVNSRVGREEKPAALRSRGTIIPDLLPCEALVSVLSKAVALDSTLFAPFRLVLVDREELAELCSDGQHVRLVCRMAVAEPACFTSSGLGDHRVEGPRRRLFAEVCRRPGDLAVRQVAFHRHHWPDRPHLSVCMRRKDARTVSHTVVTLGPNDVTLTYSPDTPDRPAPATFVRLPLAEANPT